MLLLILIIIFILAAGILLTIIKAINHTEDDIPVRRRKLLSEPEVNFYRVLRSIIPDEREISCKCRLEDIMYVDNCPKKTSYRNKINCRHVDFVIYNPVNGYTDFAIELDDKSHESERQIKSDRFKDMVFKKIGMPLIRIKAKPFYQPEELKKIIEEKLKQ